MPLWLDGIEMRRALLLKRAGLSDPQAEGREREEKPGTRTPSRSSGRRSQRLGLVALEESTGESWTTRDGLGAAADGDARPASMLRGLRAQLALS